MKAHVTNTPKEFRPITLTLTLESQRELNAIATLFNCAPIIDVLELMGVPKGFYAEVVRPLEGYNANSGLTNEFCRHLQDTPWFMSTTRR